MMQSLVNSWNRLQVFRCFQISCFRYYHFWAWKFCSKAEFCTGTELHRSLMQLLANLEQSFHWRYCNSLGILWVGNLSHLPLGIFSLSISWDPGFSALLSKTYFHMERLLCSTTRTADKLSSCTLQLLCWAYRAHRALALWCCAEARFCFVCSFILSCFVGSYILSYCVLKSQLRKEVYALQIMVWWRQPRGTFTSQSTRVLEGDLPNGFLLEQILTYTAPSTWGHEEEQSVNYSSELLLGRNLSNNWKSGVGFLLVYFFNVYLEMLSLFINLTVIWKCIMR